MSKTLPPAPAPFEAPPALEQFMEKHFKSMVMAVALVVLALVGYAVFRLNSQKKTEEAGAAFVAAKTVVDCDLVIQKYAGTEAAGNALLLKADLFWEENKKDSSVAALREFVAKHSEHPFFPPSLVALASKLDSTGERAEAKTLFERVVAEFPDADVAPLAQIRLGDILWAEGKEDEAKKAYESLPAKFANADSAFINESEERLKWIEAKLPTKEVDGPPKPKEATPAPGAIPGMPDLSKIPGMPQMKLNSGSLSPTVTPDAAGNAPMIQLKPTPAAPAGAPGVTKPAPTLTPPVGTPPSSAPATPPSPAPLAAPKPAAAAPVPVVPSPVAPAPVTPTPAPSAATPAPTPAAPAPAPPPKAP
ncbi:MAG: tetratricopeptide repeat protein [Prosthecobacter sp.]|nr:tetratricopeptide repeat protein [Prosthecobacter sp.]